MAISLTSAVRFVACCSLRDREFSERVGNWKARCAGSLGCGFCHKELGVLSSLRFSTYPASIFILDGSASSHKRSGKCKAILEQGNSCPTSATSSLSLGIWNSFSDFVQRVVVQRDNIPTDSGVPLQSLLQDLPLLQVSPRTIPTPFDAETATDDVLSQLLYAGLGNISSTLDGFFSVIFPRMSASSVKVVEEEKVGKEWREPEAGRYVSAQELGSSEAFYAWLKSRLPQGGTQLELWGTAPGTKRVANLWRELLEGEILIEDSCPPKRTVHVASVRIVNEAGKMLVEAYQEMADGRIRPRNRPLSEKMRPGESVEEACLRGILEELGEHMGSRDRVVLRQETYSREQEERESFSYPGLMTTYVVHTMSAHVKQLPSTDFDTEEDEDAGVLVSTGSTPGSSSSSAIGVRRHFWKWV